MLHKILHKVDHLLLCKLPEFAKPIGITRHTAQQNDKVLAWLDVTSIINSLSVLPVLLLIFEIVYLARLS